MLAGCFLFSHEMPKTWNKKKDIDKQHRKKKEENKHLLCWCSLCLYNADDLLWFSLHHRHCLSHKQQFKEKTNVHSSMSISIIFKFIFAWSSWAGHPHLSPRYDSLSLINKCAILMDKIAVRKKKLISWWWLRILPCTVASSSLNTSFLLTRAQKNETFFSHFR